MVERDYEIDAIKGFAILLVVLGHVILLFVSNDSGHNLILEFARMIYTFHMPLFFFISGYLVFSSFANSRNLITWTKEKFVALIKPYVIFTVIYYYFLHGFNFEYIASKEARWWLLGDLIQKLCSFVKPDSAWFLPVLFELLIIMAIINNFENKLGKYGKYLFPTLFLLLLFILPLSPIVHIKGVDQIIQFLPFVMAGYYINNFKYTLANISKINYIILYIICVSFFPLLYLIKFVSPLMNIINSTSLLASNYNFLLAISGTMLSILVIHLLSGNLIGHGQLFFASCGIYSMEIYLIHIIVLNYSCYYHLPLWPDSGIIGVFIGTLSILFMSLAISYLMSYNKWISQFFFARWSLRAIIKLFKTRKIDYHSRKL